MSDPVHVITQLQDAVEARIRSVVPEFVLVCDNLRAQSEQFQSNELPVCIVTIAESVAPISIGQPGKKPMKRMLAVQLAIGLPLEDQPTERTFASWHLKLERELADGNTLGVTGLKDWTYSGSQPSQAIVDMGIAAKTVNFTCMITTKPGDPSSALV
ncbi:hypothetical protein [Rhizobium laguerreae]|uniref:hypothetical protein n=1 Tax=Rhizobium laguerreae TaxID=1076926 RepID=UPI001C9008E4|nr:hypothetical protein [Rhizobium laguerreae]MBY3363750.1 hypothetical protein [Rhizobium laguerreae]